MWLSLLWCYHNTFWSFLLLLSLCSIDPWTISRVVRICSLNDCSLMLLPHRNSQTWIFNRAIVIIRYFLISLPRASLYFWFMCSWYFNLWWWYLCHCFFKTNIAIIFPHERFRASYSYLLSWFGSYSHYDRYLSLYIRRIPLAWLAWQMLRLLILP